METIRLGSTGDAVKKWQGILGVAQDGVFGRGTQSATQDWQKNHKLVPDGVVGPASWAAAGVSTGGASVMGATVPTASQPIDKEAYEIAKRANPSLSERERQYVLAVARGEGFYGRGWANPSKATLDKSAKFGLTGYEGKGSNNWGSVQGKGSAGSFTHVDSHADGSLYTAQYKSYLTPEEGFNDMARIILKPNVKAALSNGSLQKAVYAQHDNKYFELDPARYLDAVLTNYGTLTTNVGWSRLLSKAGGIIGGTLMGAGIVLLGGALFFLLKGAR